MIIEAIMSACSDSLGGVMNSLPGLNVQLDTAAVNNAISTMQAWDNWLPVHEFFIAFGIMVGVWTALEGLRIAMKAWETVKP